MIIGGQKCGTTTLWKYLNTHAEIRMCPKKELHYFDRSNFSPNDTWYKNHFDVDAKVSGEATPAYCFWPGAIERIFHFDSELKLIMILRNPVERAISHYWMEFNRKQENLPILDAFRSEDQRLSTGDPYELRHHSYLARGRYHEQLDTIYSFFAQERVFLCKLEDLAARTNEVIRDISTFLGVRKRTSGKPLPFLFRGQYASPSPDVVAYLKEYFEPHNKALTEKYSIPINDWN